MPDSFIHAHWSAPSNVNCLVSTREGGVSQGNFAEFNLGLHVGDNPEAVGINREKLQLMLGRHRRIQWLEQVHGTRVFRVDAAATERLPRADGLYTREKSVVCAVLTADCLPVCLCASDGSEIGIAHAGWRGLAGGVLENTLACFRSPPERIMAWLGPAIGPCHFEVGGEVRGAFLNGGSLPADVDRAFRPSAKSGKWLADLYALARGRLRTCGVTSISGGDLCTWCDDRRFYSYRRQAVTGRFATLVYLA
ncbi:MAG: peptidoglycan editing factor PgeF [Pseudohongiellaceae bacterium]